MELSQVLSSALPPELDKQAEIINELQPVPGATSKTDLSNARKLLFRLLRSGHGFPQTAAYGA